MPKRDELAFVREAFALEAEEALAAGSLGFYGRIFCQCSLPYQDPGAVVLWSRRAGRASPSPCSPPLSPTPPAGEW